MDAGISFMERNKSYANELRLKVADHVRTLARAEGIETQQPAANPRPRHAPEAHAGGDFLENKSPPRGGTKRTAPCGA